MSTIVIIVTAGTLYRATCALVSLNRRAQIRTEFKGEWERLQTQAKDRKAIEAGQEMLI